MNQTLVMNNFRGGLVDSTALETAPNECTELVGLDHTGEGLRVMAGPNVLPLDTKYLHSDGCTTGTKTAKAFVNVDQYVDANGKTYLVGKRGHTVWVGVPNAADVMRSEIWDNAAYLILPLDESGSTVTNRASYSYAVAPDITNYGSQPHRRWSGYVRQFNTTDFVLTDLQASTGDSFRFAAWVRWTGPTSTAGCILNARHTDGTEGGIYIGRDTNGKLYCKVMHNATGYYVTKTSATTLAVDTWYHIVVTKALTANSVPIFYINGSVDAGSTTSNEPVGFWYPDLNAIKIGANINASNQGSGGWQGQMGDVIWGDRVGPWTSATPVLAMYNRMLDKYAASPTDIDYNWYPLLGDVYYDVDTRYLNGRIRSDEPESFVQIGNYLYFSPDEPMTVDYVMRWDGTLISTDMCYTSGGILYSEYPLSHSDVRSGDIIYFAKWDSTAGAYRWDELNGRVISNLNDTRINLTYAYTTTGLGHPDTPNYLPYCVARVHRLGIPAPVAPTGAVKIYAAYDSGSGYTVNDVLTLTGGGNNCTAQVLGVDGAGSITWLSDPVAAGTGYTAEVVYETTVAPAGGAGCRIIVLELVPTCTVAAAAGGSLEIATYRYKWRYKNGYTTRSGNISSASSTITSTAANASVSVSGWGTTDPPADALDVNEVQIYRSKNSQPYYYVGSVYGNIATNFTSPFVDTGSYTPTEDDLLDEDYADYHTRPGALRGIRYYKNRLIAGGGPTTPHYLYASTFDDIEYFPEVAWTGNNPQFSLQLLGFQYMAGDSIGEPVNAMIPEVGAFDGTGQIGADLLIMLPNRSVRWFGSIWSEFGAIPAFGKGTLGPRSVMRTTYSVVFIDREHIYEVPFGGNNPMSIEGRLWPNGLGDKVSDRDILDDWRLALWNGWYLFLGRLSGSTNDTIWMFHPATGTWTSESGPYNDLLTPADQTLHGVLGANNVTSAYSTIHQADVSGLFEDKTTARSITYATGALLVAQEPGDILRGAKIERVTLVGRADPSSAISISLAAYTMGDRTTANYGPIAKSLAAQAGTTSKRGYVRWKPTETVYSALPSLKFTSSDAIPGAEINAVLAHYIFTDYDSTGL